MWYAYLNRCNFAKCKFSEIQGSANACFPVDKPIWGFTPEALTRKSLQTQPLQKAYICKFVKRIAIDMSTYIDTVHPDRHAPYLDIPNLVVDYLHYLDFVRQNSPRTINGYYLDLRGFFRYMMVVWGLTSEDTPPEKVDLTHITKEQISKIKKRDVLNYLDYTRSQDNGPRARARKLSALRGFFNYLCNQVN